MTRKGPAGAVRRTTTLTGLVLTVALAAACGAPAVGRPSSRPTTGSSPVSPAATPDTPSSPTSPAAPSASRSASPGATPAGRRAAARIAALARPLGRQGVSVAALDLASGARFEAGAVGGMTEASVAKLDIVESLMLRRQRSGEPLRDTELDEATEMIEQSDNADADALWQRLGGRVGVGAANVAFGLHCTRLATNGYWGLSTTCAADQLALLHALVARRGPLGPASQRFVLGLMRHVESDQRWGVGAAADPGTSFANKNGWLSVLSDDDLWAVNSVGIIRVDGRTVLLAVLSQHNRSFGGGISVAEGVGRAAVDALAAAG